MAAKRKTKAPNQLKTEPVVDGRHLRRQRTEEKLIEAVGALLRKGGVAALGVNAVAEHADVEKVLVYRYFGGLDGLMDAYAARSDFWPTLEELVGEDGALLRDRDKPRIGARVLANYAAALRKRPVTLDLLAWECSNRNALTVALERVREERGRELLVTLEAAGVPALGDLGALFAAAINYLAVRGRDLRVFGGLPVHGDAAWDHIEELMLTVFRAVAGSGSRRAQRE